MKIQGKLIFVISFIALIFPINACAYIDLGTGSYFLQILLGFVFGLIFSIKLFWNKIALFLNSKFKKKSNDNK